MTALLPSTSHAPGQALSLDRLIQLVRAYSFAEDSWRPRLHLPAEGEERWWTQLHGDPNLDVWLLAWQPGHFTDLHDHGASAAAFAVVQGELAEHRLDRSGDRISYRHSRGSTTWVAPGVIHDVHAVAAGSVSIHAYSPPLTQMTYYHSGADGRLQSVETVQTKQPEQGPRR